MTSPGAGSPGAELVLVEGAAGFGTPPGVILGSNTFTASTRIDFVPPVTAVGFDLITILGGNTADIEIYDPGGLLINGQTGVPGGAAGAFWGVDTDLLIGAIVINDPTGGDVELLDNMEFGVTSQAPPNDLCADAEPISCDMPFVTGTTIDATTDGFPFCGTSNTSPGVWYSIIGNGGDITVDTCTGTAYDSKISVYTDSCDPATTTCVDGNDDDCGLQSLVTWTSVPGQEYYILVHGFGGATGDFQLSINCAAVPAIDLTKTVGDVPAVCATTDTITVSSGTMVYYCYEVQNTGTVALDYHTLIDDQLGQILAGAPVPFGPGDIVQVIVPAVITAPVVNTATWTASDTPPGGYVVDDTINYFFEDISATGTPFTLFDDDTIQVPIGFTFNYYGMAYTDFWVSSNGFMSDADYGSGCCTGQPLPDTGTPNGTIAGWWEDLDPGEPGAALFYETLGTAPNRYLVVTFQNVQHFPSGNPVTMQYKLFEGSDIIEVHYQDAPSDGGTHSAGIENQDGTLGIQYYLGPAALMTPLAVQYAPVVGIEASDTDSATVNVSDPDIDVTPTSLFSSQLVDTIVTLLLDISNLGTADLIWNIEEAVPAMRMPASDGNFPRGTAEPSMERAPVMEHDRARPSGWVPLRLPGELTYATHFDLNTFLSYFSSFDTDTPETVTNILEIFPFYPAGDFVLGDFTTMYALDYDNPQLVAIDTATGAETVIGPNAPSGNWGGAAGDTDGTFYAVSAVCGVSSTLYTIDLATGAATMVGDMGPDATCMIGIAINSQGDMYGFDIVTDTLLSVDKATGLATTIGPLGYDANFSQGCDFDETLDILYLAAYNNASGTGELRVADLATGNTTLIGLFGGTGLLELNTIAIAAGGACTNPLDVPWLSVNPTAGTTPPAGTDTLDVTFDSNGVAIGTYDALLCVWSNDPDEPLVQVPTTMEVIIPVELMSFTIE